jgi:hypothetical protein
MTNNLLVCALYSEMLNFWKLMGLEEFFVRVSFIVVAVVAFRVLM